MQPKFTLIAIFNLPESTEPAVLPLSLFSNRTYVRIGAMLTWQFSENEYFSVANRTAKNDTQFFLYWSKSSSQQQRWVALDHHLKKLNNQQSTHSCSLFAPNFLLRHNTFHLHLVSDSCMFLFECADFPRKYQQHSRSKLTNLTNHRSLPRQRTTTWKKKHEKGNQ